MITRTCRTLAIWCAAFFFLVSASSAFAFEKSGFANLTYDTGKVDDSGEVTRARTFSQNYTLQLGQKLTPMLSTQLFIRAFLSDKKVRDPDGVTTEQYTRQIEPLFEINLQNPLYAINAGYRRTEFWDTKSLRNDSRLTTDYYYARLDLTPREFPFFSFQADRQNRYNHLSPRSVDSTRTTYSGNSNYSLRYRDFNFTYSASYTHTEDKSPVLLIKKQETDNFSGSYNLGFNKQLLNGKLYISTAYQGNYTWINTKISATTLGSASLPVIRLDGLYAQGAAPPPANNENVGFLPSLFALIDGNTVTATAIDLTSAVPYHNIGVSVPASSPVDRIYVYVNRNIMADTVLSNAANWQAYTSNNNFFGMPNTLWTQIPIQSVTRSIFDAANNIYRYEIVFTTRHTALFFKVVNMQPSNVAGPVNVTEVEAFGPVTTTASRRSETTFETFSQGLNANVTYQVIPRLKLLAGFFVNRTDLNPSSITTAMGGIFENTVSKKINGTADNTNVSRSYTVGATWQTHRYLTTDMRYTRNEVFNSSNTSDFSNNNYQLIFSSSPLPTVDASLALTRNESYSFGTKQSTNDSAVLTVGTKLYANINMVTDVGYLRVKSYLVDTKTDSWYVSGSLTAVLTPKLSGSLDYELDWTDAPTGRTDSQEIAVQLTYRPGRYINISGNYKVRNTDGLLSYERGIMIDWLPLATIRMNLSYQNFWSEPTPDTTDMISGYVLWRITKFIDAQITYSQTREEKAKVWKAYTLTGNLNCRF